MSVFLFVLILNKYPVLVIWFSVCGQVPKNGTKINQSLNTQMKFEMKAVFVFLHLIVRSCIRSLTISRRIDSFHISWFFLCVFFFHLLGLVYPRSKTALTLNTSFNKNQCFRYIIRSLCGSRCNARGNFIHKRNNKFELKWNENSREFENINVWLSSKAIRCYVMPCTRCLFICHDQWQTIQI